MSVLVDRDILEAVDCGQIIIEPFDRACLGTNSYDVHLAPTLRVYKGAHKVRIQTLGYSRAPYEFTPDEPLDVRVQRDTADIVIPEDGFVLEPGELYLASTVEYTESLAHVPVLNGRSSLGRLGLSIHVTAGTGDVGFRGPWTMEMFVIKRLRVYPGIPIGQLLWFETSGAPLVTYDRKLSAKYNRSGELPQPSRLYLELGPNPKDG